MKSHQLKKRVAIVCIGVFLLEKLIAEETPNRHVQNVRFIENKSFLVENFKVDRSIISFEIPGDNWSGIYPSDETLAQYYHRAEEGCSIEVYQLPLKELPKDEANAVRIYEAMLPVINPGFMIRGGRASDYIKIPSSFPYNYTMVVSTEARPVIMNTVFIHSTYLYSIRLKVASELKGSLRKDLYSLLTSFRIEQQNDKLVTVAAEEADASIASEVSANPEKAISTSEQEQVTQDSTVQNADQIKKMIAEVYSPKRDSSQRGDYRMGKGDGTSPIDGLIDKLGLDHRTVKETSVNH